jgi:hypothetical protein
LICWVDGAKDPGSAILKEAGKHNFSGGRSLLS